jgi:hypothetical protein
MARSVSTQVKTSTIATLATIPTETLCKGEADFALLSTAYAMRESSNPILQNTYSQAAACGPPPISPVGVNTPGKASTCGIVITAA